MAEDQGSGVFQAKGVNGQITVTPTLVTIARKGIRSFLTQGMKGDKEIRIEQVSAIQLKRASRITNGFLQFSFIGGAETKGGAMNATRDENTVMFDRKQEADFLRVKELVEQYRDQLRSTNAAGSPADTPDVLDQIKRLSELRDAGALSDEEFEAKKAELLDRL